MRPCGMPPCNKAVVGIIMVLVWLIYLAFDHSVGGYDSMWSVHLQTPLIGPSSPSVISTTGEGGTSWGVCKCDIAMGCIFITRGCVTRVLKEVVIITPLDPRANTVIGNALFQCKTSMSGKTRMATKSEGRHMLEECPVDRREDALTMLNYRRFNFHPYHSVMNPTGALQHFSVLNVTRHLLAQYNLRLPPHIITMPTTLLGHTANPAPLGVARFMEYALSHRYGEDTSIGLKPEDVNVTIGLVPPTLVSCSLYHTVGLLMMSGLFVHPKNGMTTPIPRQWAHDFRAFREMVRSRSLSDYGSVPIDESKPVIYVPRSQVCEEDRVRFIPTNHRREMEKVFLQITNSSGVEVNKFHGNLSSYPYHFRSIQSRRILFGSEGAFFTMMLIGRPESVWVIYYRAPPMKYRSHGFFTSMVRNLPDLKLVIYVVTNGVAPPMSDLERAVTEPFIPGVPKFVGADKVGNPPKTPGKDPLFSKCEDIVQ